MPTTLKFEMSYPLPAELSPEEVVAALQRYEPLISPNPYLVSWRPRPVDVSEIVDDDFFRDDGTRLAAFEIVDRIVLVPGIASKQITIPCMMQSFTGGVRCRSIAQGGVRVWSTWTVQPRTRLSDKIELDLMGAEAGDWELVEEARVECSSLVKPFVARSFESAHRTILKRTVAEIVRQSRKPIDGGPAIRQESGRAKTWVM